MRLMTQPINNGGPAFPIAEFYMPNGNLAQVGHPGMSLRDYWAGQVVNGELAGLPPENSISAEALAKWGFIVADAMIAARHSDPEPTDAQNPYAKPYDDALAGHLHIWEKPLPERIFDAP